jgi:adenylate cyclase
LSQISESMHQSSAVYRRTTMIVTGLILFAFITSHLVNLTLGLISVDVMDNWRWLLSGLWTGPVFSQVLTLALALHFVGALISLYYRNTLRIPTYDMAQMVAGLAIVPLLAPHVFGVMAYQEMGLVPTYNLLLGFYWNTSPYEGLRQVVLLVVAWLHGGIGIYTWLRARDTSARVLQFFYPLVVLIPILAMLGYVEAGRQVIPVSEGGTGWVAAYNPNVNGPTVDPAEIPAIIEAVKWNSKLATEIALGLAALAFAARWVRIRAAERGRVRVLYTGKRPVRFVENTGLTLLEMAHVHDVPHASICRGRGRCGTCRVRVLKSENLLPPPDASEAKVLAHWNAGPTERLACQVFPKAGVVEVERVVAPDYSDLDYSQTGKPALLKSGETSA